MEPGKENGKKRDFRIFLQETYLERLSRNPRYSLRAYARTLGMNSGTLSQLLSGKRALTAKTRERLLHRLGLEPHRALEFLAPFSGPQAGAFDQLPLDTFAVIADWYHYAILELTHIRGFRPDARWVARKLGISVTEVKIAVERLARLGFLEVRRDRWTDIAGNLTTIGSELTTLALRKLQNQILEMALRANNEIPPERRDQSSLTVFVDSGALPEIKEKIKALRRELDLFIESRGNPDSVYHLCLSFYPVTRVEESAP